MCSLQARKAFKNDTLFEVTFPYNSKTTIASIGRLLKEKDL